MVAINLAMEENDEFGGLSESEFNDRLYKAFNCTKLRLRIKKFLATKEMTQTAFLREISANSNSFRNFMSYSPFQGIDNQTFRGGAAFFLKRDLQAKKSPKVKSTGPSRKNIKEMEAETLAKVASVELPEDTPVFDDCNQVRTSIMTFLNTKVMTQAAFCRAVSANSNSLRQFLAFKGKDKGAGHGIYPAAYRFFEKLRIAEGEPKSKSRLKNEKDHPLGFSLEAPRRYEWVFGKK